MSFVNEGAGRVTLMDVREPGIHIHLDAHLARNGDLCLEGQDLGPKVEELTGDDEYEYFLTVRAEHVGAVAAALACQRDNLLAALRDAYANETFTGTADLKALLDRLGIPSETHEC